jgi:hypothetical protein
MNIPYFAALAYPLASEAGLLLAHNWLSWILVYDDSLDEGTEGLNPNKIKQNRKNFLSIFRGSPTDLADPLSVALDDIWRQIVSLSDRVWQYRFIHNTNLYLEAVEWEAHNRLRRSLPSEKEYLQRRLETSAAQPCIDLLIPLSNINLPKLCWKDEKISHLEILTSEIIILTNDIISFPKEQASNDLHNIVLIRAAAQRCDPKDVLTQVAQLLTRRIDSFRNIAREIQQGSYSDDCIKYVSALEESYVGTFTWHLNSGRY